MNQAVTQMDEVTQQNAALVEEAAAAAESVEEQAQNLTAAVGIFKLDSSHHVQQQSRRIAAPVHQHAGKAAEKHAPAAPARKPAAKPAPAAKPKALQAKTSKSEDGEWEEF